MLHQCGPQGVNVADLHQLALGNGDVVSRKGSDELLGVDFSAVGHAGADDRVGRVAGHGGDLVGEIGAFHDGLALAVNQVPLAADDVVVLEHLFALVGVFGLEEVLGGLHRARGGAADNGLVFGIIGVFGHEFLGFWAAVNLEQVVLEGEVKLGFSRVTLTAGAAAELVVDPGGFVALRPDDAEAAGRPHAGPELDVGAAAGHIGRDGHGAPLAGLGDDGRFFGEVFRVEHLVGNAGAAEGRTELFRRAD